MPFSADYDSFTKSSEKDIGFVWGLPVDGPDLFDVPLHLTVAATAPPKQTTISIAVYVIEEDDCTDPSMGEKMREAKTKAILTLISTKWDEPVFEETDYEFEFNIDPGHYCLIAEYIDGNGDQMEVDGMELSVDGKLYPNQFFAGLQGWLAFRFPRLPSSVPNAMAVLCASCSRAKTNPPNPRCFPKPVKHASLRSGRSTASRSKRPTMPSEGPSEPPAETAPAEPPAEASESTEAPPAAATPAASQPEGP